MSPFNDRDPIQVQKSTEILLKQRVRNRALRLVKDSEVVSTQGGK